MPREEVQVRVNGRTLTVSNLSKVFYPETGTTKGDVLSYYIKIAPVMLKHLRNRPITLKRYPDGVEGLSFFEKKCPSHRPDWVETVDVPSERKGNIPFCMLNDIESLAWVANLAALELHPQLALGESIDCPTAMVFDLDPGAPATLLDCCHVALELRALLRDFGLRSYPKTSGGKGLHFYVPLNTPVTYQLTKGFAHAVAQLFERHHPDQATSIMAKDRREGKVFIDWSQNDRHKTTVSVYSLRARSRPTVSTPISWEEVESAWDHRDASGLVFEYPGVLERVDRSGDLFSEVLTQKQTLPPVEKRRLAA
jgi:bifunctional non-homologous end joining protein LigD